MCYPSSTKKNAQLTLSTAVGRWQKGKDLTWYAKGDSDTALTPEQQRLAEIKRIKEIEQDALSEALGFKVVRRHVDTIDQDEVRRVIKESGVGDQPEGDDKEEAQGVGFGKGGRSAGGQLGKEDEKGATNDDSVGRVDTGYRVAGEKERLEGYGRSRKDKVGGGGRDRDRERDGHRRRHRSRSQSPSRNKERERHRHRRDRDESQRRRHRKSRSASPRRHRDRRDHDDKNGRREGRGDGQRGERDRARDGDKEGRRRRRSKSPGRPRNS